MLTETEIEILCNQTLNFSDLFFLGKIQMFDFVMKVISWVFLRKRLSALC